MNHRVFGIGFVFILGSVSGSVAGGLTLSPDEGLRFVEEPGVRLQHEGISTPSGPDCHVFREDGKVVYRIWWTTVRYAAQKKDESRWSIHTSVSNDGLTFRYERGPEFAKGRYTNRTDRDLFRQSNGRWRAYTLIGGGNPWYCIDSFQAGPAAKDWVWERGVRINFGAENSFDHTAARSPEAVQLDDGSIRVYYLGWNGPNGPYTKDRGSDERWRILSARSKDGVHFTKEAGVRIDVDAGADPPHGAASMTKPLVVRLTNGRWRMYFSARKNGKTEPYGAAELFLSESDDGLTWKRGPRVPVERQSGEFVDARNPSLVRTPEGRLRLYYDGGGVRSALAQPPAR